MCHFYTFQYYFIFSRKDCRLFNICMFIIFFCNITIENIHLYIYKFSIFITFFLLLPYKFSLYVKSRLGISWTQHNKRYWKYMAHTVSPLVSSCACAWTLMLKRCLLNIHPFTKLFECVNKLLGCAKICCRRAAESHKTSV